MIRLILPLTTLCCALFSTALGAMRAPRYDDGGLRTSLSAPGCALPCFMGIRPGITSEDEAVRLLQAHPWVASVYLLLNDRGLAWTWNGQQPAFLQGGYGANSLLITGGIVYRIDVLTQNDLATFLLEFGLPDAWNSFSWLSGRPQSNMMYDTFVQRAVYAAYPMEVTASGTCPLSLRDRWALPAQISLFDQRKRPGFDDVGGTPLVLVALRGHCA